MLDDDFAFHLIEYNDQGAPIRESVETVPIADPAVGLVERIAASEEELENMGASRTGAKSIPDNTDSLGIFFRMVVPSTEPPQGGLLPVWETESPWRRGRGMAFWKPKAQEVRIWGLWFPWWRPKKPKIELQVDEAAMHVTPGQLLGRPE